MLGTNVGSLDMVQYCQSLGYFVIVTDSNSEQFGAKTIANQVASVSTRDIPSLIELCKSEKISAVIAGVNEGNIRSALSVSETLGLPFYCSSDQWELVMDKSKFRDLCDRNGVPSPKTFFAGLATDFQIDSVKLEFPLVIKPVDASALAGISICNYSHEVAKAIQTARENSITESVIIEEFVDGVEFTAAYAVVEGQLSLSSIDDRYPLVLPGMSTSFPILRVYPSLHAQSFIDECTHSLTALCREIGLENGCIFFQGIRSSKGYAIFEAGLRLAGEATYRFLQPLNGVNPLHHITDVSIGRVSNHAIEKDDPFLGGKVAAIISFVSSGGVISEMHGLEEAQQLENLIEWEQRYAPGDLIPNDGTLRQIVLRYILECANYDELNRDIALLSNLIKVLDNNGDSMVFYPTMILK